MFTFKNRKVSNYKNIEKHLKGANPSDLRLLHRDIV